MGSCKERVVALEGVGKPGGAVGPFDTFLGGVPVVGGDFARRDVEGGGDLVELMGIDDVDDGVFTCCEAAAG